MCFHSKQSKDAPTVQNRFKATIKDTALFNSQSEFNGFTFPKTPIITNAAPQIIQHFNWGLIPTWSKDNSIRAYTLNARIETITEKPSFKNYIQHRCLVLADGFYEWKWLDSKGKNKQKYLITLPNEELYAYAGIYSEYTDQETGETINSYSIVTTEANALMSEIHNIKKRMPIILKPEDESNWLNGVAINNFKLPYQVRLKALNIDINNTPTLF